MLSELENFLAFLFTMMLFASIMAICFKVGNLKNIKDAQEKENEDTILRLNRTMEIQLSGVTRSIEDFDTKANDFLQQVPPDLHENFMEKINYQRGMLDACHKLEKHRITINKKLNLALKFNDYGAVVADKRSEVYQEYVESMGYEHDEYIESQLIKALEQINKIAESLDFDPKNYPSDGHEFETWVAENLTKFGWKAEVTPGSGDQGADVIARKGTVNLGVQCKQYTTGKVGNQAVQEIVAAKSLYGFSHLAVVTTGDYTKSAHELAEANSVKLLSHHDIPRFDDIFST